MRPRRSGQLVRRLVGAVFAAGTVAAVAGSLLIWTVARSALQAEIADGNASLAEELAIRFDGRLDSVTDILRVVATRDALTGSSATATDALRAVLTASASFDELLLYDAAGRPAAAAATRFLADPDAYPDRPELLDQVAGGSVLTVLEDFPPVLEVAVPVERPAGTVVGAVVARLPLDVVAAPLRQADPASRTVRFLVDRDGRILVHPERDRVADGERFPAAVAGERDGPTVLDVEGVPSLVAVAPTRLLGGAVVLQQAVDEALSPADRQLRQMTAALLATMIATVAALSIVGGYLLRPLRPLADAVGRLERGERGVSVDVPTTDEVGQLAQQLNQMAATLDRRRDEIEELHRLSLLLNSRAARQEVVDDIARGAARLLGAEAGAFLVDDGDGAMTVRALSGDVPDHRTLQATAARCAESTTTLTEEGQRGEALLAVPVAGASGGTDGVLVVVRTAEPLRDEDRQLAQTFASFAGVALGAVHRLELERSLVHELQEAVDRKRQLITSVTHEFLTPLTCIESFSARLLEQDDPPTDEERRRLASEIHDQARELDDVMTTLLDLVMSERGRRSVNAAAVPLRTAVSSAIDAVAPLLGERPVETDVAEIEVVADPVLLVRLLTSLLSNAAKYSPPSTPIVVRATLDGDAVRVDVIDEGIGIEPEAAARIFEPFWRAPQEPGRRGMGVGLALAADYVQAMQGTISVRSAPGQGSTFSFTLPPAPAQGAAARPGRL